MTSDLLEKLKDNALLLTVLVSILIVGVVIAGCLLLPEVFYDNWIWKYYWGPVVADATGQAVSHNGVTAVEGYTWVSEITYGLIVVCALYGIFRLLKKLEIGVDWWFFVALSPYILYGPLTRVLEDSSYYLEPMVFWFISPLIYLQTAAFMFGFLALGVLFEKVLRKKKMISLLVFSSVIAAANVVYVLMWRFEMLSVQRSIDPIVFVLLSVFASLPFIYRFLMKKKLTLKLTIGCGGLLIFLPSLYVTSRWLIGDVWAQTSGIRFDVLLIVSLLVAVIVGVFTILSMVFKGNETAEAFSRPLNLAMVAGHMVDGLASWISIYDPLKFGNLNYAEKHPASNWLMEVWPPLFPMVKLVLIILIIYIFDILYKEEMKEYRTLGNLLKIGIIILGLAPGLRDLLRVTMGV